jgi:hypothetical protein
MTPGRRGPRRAARGRGLPEGPTAKDAHRNGGRPYPVNQGDYRGKHRRSPDATRRGGDIWPSSQAYDITEV